MMKMLNIKLSYDRNRFIESIYLVIAVNPKLMIQHPPIHPNDRPDRLEIVLVNKIKNKSKLKLLFQQ